MNLTQTEELIEGLSPAEALSKLCDLHPGKVVFTTSFGIEDQVISDIIFSNELPVRVVTLDTGRLFEETYRVFNNTLKRYDSEIEVYSPDTTELERLVTKKGPYSFYRSVEERKECCNIRKVKPLNRALEGMEIWITGIRADQSKGRTGMQDLELDDARGIIKYHPLFSWSLQEVESYLHDKKVPYNELHDKGFVSIGCAPCTRAIRPGEDFRSGRWWWENNSGKECGLHR